MSDLHFEVVYFRVTSRGDLVRMLLEVTGANYRNRFVEWGTGEWEAMKGDTQFGKLPVLVVHGPDGSKKEIAESFAIELYLAETFDLFPASDAFARAESLSVLAALHELEENVLYAALRIPTVEARKAAHEKIMRETAPAFLAFQERFVRGAFYFGDKPTVADYKLYQMFLRLGDAYGEANPLRVGQYPKLQKIIAALEAGPAGDYARSRRAFGIYAWRKDEWTWKMLDAA